MFTEVTIGPCRLILGDCLEVLPTLEKVDSVVTDPPYSIRNKMANFKHRTVNFEWDSIVGRDDVINGISLGCDLAQAFFLFCGMSQVSFIELALEDRFTVKPAIWIKAHPPPAAPGNWWPSGFEYAAYGYRPGAYFGDADTRRRNVFYSDTYRNGIRADEKVDHPTQKWLPLMDDIVSAVVPPAGLCLDQFMGSGTTGVACIRAGRHFIGIEKDERYFQIAAKRIEQAWSLKQTEIKFDKEVEPVYVQKALSLDETSTAS